MPGEVIHGFLCDHSDSYATDSQCHSSFSVGFVLRWQLVLGSSLVVQYISGILVMNVGSCGSMDDAWFVRRCAPWSYSSPLQCCWPPLSCGVRGSSVEPSVITCRTNMVLIHLISDSRDSEFALVWPPPLILVGAEWMLCRRSWKLRFYVLDPNHQSDVLHFVI